MSRTSTNLLYWTPRILCFGFAIFLSIFALDVFSLPDGFWLKTVALVMHLIPTMLVLAMLAIVWQHEWAGAILFPILALFHLVTMWGRLDWQGYAVIESPLILIGALFLGSWLTRSHAEPPNSSRFSQTA